MPLPKQLRPALPVDAHAAIGLRDPLPTLRAMGIGSLVFSPCANVPARGGFLTVMGENVENLRRALGDGD